jgi:hypothetical protein
MQRRTWLKLGIAGTVVLTVAGGGVALMRPGLDDNGGLKEAGRIVFTAVGVAVLDGSLPQEIQAKQVALVGLIERIDAFTRGLPPHAQTELSQLLALLGTSAGRIGLAGLRTEWSEASVGEVQNSLESMRLSGVALKRQAYAALHDIVGATYFSDASTWTVLGYPGPIAL